MAIVPRHTPKSHITVRDERNVEFFMVSNALIDVWAARLSHATFKVYIGLHRYASGSAAVVSYKTLCARLNMSRATVASSLATLEAEHLIRIEHHVNERGIDLNTYVLLALPVSSIIELTSDGEFNDRTNPSSISEPTLVQSVNYVLKTEEIKDEGVKEVAVSPVVLRIRERDSRRLAKR